MINIVEVGPRDGFQNVKEFIDTEHKFEIIKSIVNSGVKDIQCTSFVSPKAIAQMCDARKIVELCLSNFEDVNFFALTPNLRGVDDAVNAGLKHVTWVISLSETHNLKNINRSHQDSLKELENLRQKYPDLRIDIDLATTFGCPFEGRKSYEEIETFVDKLVKIGYKNIDLCDTIGVAYPSQVRSVIEQLNKNFPDIELSVHIHDTRNMGIINTMTAISAGVKNVQTTLGGLGGCPFAPGASGNTATEDLNYILQKEGYTTGINQDLLMGAVKKECSIIVNGAYSGHLMKIETAHADFM